MNSLGSAKIDSITTPDGKIVFNSTTPQIGPGQEVVYNLSGTVNNYGAISPGDVVDVCIKSDATSPMVASLYSVSPNLPESNPVFTVKVEGNCLHLTKNNVAGGGVFSFKIAVLGRLWPSYISNPASMTNFSIGSNVYSVAYDDTWQKRAYGGNGPLCSSDSQVTGATTWSGFTLQDEWTQIMTGAAPSIPVGNNVVVMQRFTAAAGTTITSVGVLSNTVAFTSYVNSTSTGFTGEPIATSHGGPILQPTQGAALAQDTTLAQAAAVLAPYTYGSVQNSDGSWTVAVNFGPIEANTHFAPLNGDSVNPADPNTIAWLQKAQQLGLVYNNVALPVQVEFSDPTKTDSGTLAVSTSLNSNVSSCPIGDVPVSNKAVNQTQINVHYVDVANVDRIPVEPNYGYPTGQVDPATGSSTPDLAISPKSIPDYSLVTDANAAATATGHPVGNIRTAAGTVAYPASGITDVYYVYQRSYTVNYDINGGMPTNFPAKTNVRWDDTNLLPLDSTGWPVVPAREGFKFAGWSVSTGGTKTGVTAADPFSALAASSSATAITIQAQWNAATTLSYNGNGASSGNVATVNGYVGDQQPAAANAFSRPGYTFRSWNSAADGKGTSVAPGDQVSLNGPTVLYAQWTADPATITYAAGTGATGTTAVTTGVTDQQVTVAANSFTRAGYRFLGWFDGAGTAYAAGAVVRMPVGGMKLTAIWAPNQAQLDYNANSGTGSIASTPGATDQTITVADGTVLTRSGYTFKGWNTAADGTGTAYAAGSAFKLPANGAVIYAQWTANPATITYAANRGTGTTPDTVSVTDAKVSLADGKAFTRPGYSFKGWNTAADGTGMPYAAGQSVTVPAGGMGLFAQWVADQALVTYDANHGSGIMVATASVTDGNAAAATNGFSRPGYTFTGWNTAADGKGTAFAAGDMVVTPAGGITLFAQWTAASSSISYESNGGFGNTDATVGVTDASAKVAQSTFTRDGYTFKGWNSLADSTGTAYAVGDEVKLPPNGLRLYAQWAANPTPESSAPGSSPVPSAPGATPGATPDSSPGGPNPGLPQTGGQSSLAGLLGALTLGGAGAVVFARRRRSN